ncbi:FAD/NAD(P)-binding domain-containing protein [Phlegmacium glaucopus]|nr:FAD/NAD(P)-binding domain-containing protein [Phlegmacium glaucopus]
MSLPTARNSMFKACPCLLGRVAGRWFSSSTPRYKQRLVVLGSGWGGYNILRSVDKKQWDVTILSPNTYFNFTPLLASTAVGTLEFRCAVEPVRRYAPEVTYYQAWCDEIDFAHKRLKCVRNPKFMPATRPTNADPKPKHDGDTNVIDHSGIPFSIHFDKLVIAVGAYSQTFDVPGVKEHAHFLKDVKDARRIRGRILECFEQANQPFLTDIERRHLLNFCVVGGGPTGVEFSAELYDLLHSDIAKHYPVLAKLAKITIYDVASNILGSFDQSLRKYTENTLSREGISILTNHHVERVEAGKMIVTEQGEVPFGLLVWSTGLAPNPLVRAISEVKKDNRTSSLITNDHLNVIMNDGVPNPDVWAIVANQKAKYLVKKLNKIAKDQAFPAPFEFHNQGSLAYIGNWKAIYDKSGQSGQEDGFLQKETGRLAWLLWRSAYFTMTLSIRNRILVPTYW